MSAVTLKIHPGESRQFIYKHGENTTQLITVTEKEVRITQVGNEVEVREIKKETRATLINL